VKEPEHVTFLIVQELRAEFREAVHLLEIQIDRLDHKVNRLTAVLGTGMFLLLLVELVVLRRIGI